MAESSVAYLSSPRALDSLGRDPYWPKWDSPWWHMTALWESGEARRIPREAALMLAASMRRHHLDFFPIKPGELPKGKDPYRNIVCHCALGTIHQVLRDCGTDPDAALPWARGWFLKYQLPDGGWNCDEKAYLKDRPKSSIVSTVPVLEALLDFPSRTPAEDRALDAGAQYMIDHRLFRRAGGGSVIDEAWLKPVFPRFYDYDLLRGLSLLTRWAWLRRRDLPRRAVSEAVELLEKAFPDGKVIPAGPGCAKDDTLAYRGGKWAREPASTFPLREALSRATWPSAALTLHWERARRDLENLGKAGRLA